MFFIVWFSGNIAELLNSKRTFQRALHKMTAQPMTH